MSSNQAYNTDTPIPNLLGRMPNTFKEDNDSQFNQLKATWIKEENDQHLIEESTSEVNPFIKYEKPTFGSVKDDLDHREANTGKGDDDYLIQSGSISHEEVDIKSEDEEDMLESKLITFEVTHKPTLHAFPEGSYQSKRKGDIKPHSVKSFKHSYKTARNEILMDRFKRLQNSHQGEDTKDWLKCPDCPYKTIYKSGLKSHIIIHTPADQIQWFRCLDCSFKTIRKLSLRRHVKIHRTADQNDKDTRVWHKCPECPYKTIHKRNLPRHTAVIHRPTDQIQWFRCLDCSFKTNWKISLRKHVKIHRTADQKDKNSKVSHKCPECPYKTFVKGNLTRHTIIHKPDDQIRWFPCLNCSYKTNRKSTLKMHVMKHRTVAQQSADARVRHKCPECPYETFRKGDLTKHAIIHKPADQIQWFRCLNCSFKTIRKLSLRGHMKTHITDDQNGEDARVWHKCPECPYRTVYKRNMLRHTIIHRPNPLVALFKVRKCYLVSHVKTYRTVDQGKQS